MPLIPVPAVGSPTYQSWAKAVADRLNNPVGCSAYSPNPGTLGSTVWGPIGFTDAMEQRDVGGWHVGTNSAGFVVPAGMSGWYDIIGSAIIEVNASASFRTLGYSIDGTMQMIGQAGAAFNGQWWGSFHGLQYLAAGQALSIMIYQNSGVGLPVYNVRFQIVERFFGAFALGREDDPDFVPPGQVTPDELPPGIADIPIGPVVGP